jgi:hypothetical protein
MLIGSKYAASSFSREPKERLKDCLDELLDAAESQVDLAEEIVDIICDLQVEVNMTFGA